MENSYKLIGFISIGELNAQYVWLEALVDGSNINLRFYKETAMICIIVYQSTVNDGFVNHT